MPWSPHRPPLPFRALAGYGSAPANRHLRDVSVGEGRSYLQASAIEPIDSAQGWFEAVRELGPYDDRPHLGPVVDGRLCGELRDLAQFLGLGEARQLLQRLILDLTNPLTGDIEGAPHLIQGAWVFSAKAVSQFQDTTLSIGQGV